MDNGYAYFRIEKKKGKNTLKAMCAHNRRQTNVLNADEQMAYKNDFMYNIGDKDYWQIFNETIAASPYYKTGNKFRKDAVMAFEIEAGVPHGVEEKIDIQAWKEKTLEYIKERFGAENVKDVTYHGDEKGSTAHLHAFVIPIAEDGRLCASQFVDGPKDMSDMQTAYAQKMEQFGLKRGKKGSIARHERVSKFYERLNIAFDEELPFVMDGESAKAYRERVTPIFQDYNVKKLQDEMELTKKLTDKATDISNKFKNRYREARKENVEMSAQIKNLQNLVLEAKEPADLADKLKYMYGNMDVADDEITDDYFIKLGLEVAKERSEKGYVSMISNLENLKRVGERYYEEQVENKYRKKIKKNKEKRNEDR